MELLILTSNVCTVCVLETNFTTTYWVLSKKNRDTFTYITVKVGAVGRGGWENNQAALFTTVSFPPGYPRRWRLWKE